VSLPMICVSNSKITCVLYLLSPMPLIKLSIEEHQSLTNLLSHPKTDKYRNDRFDTETFDSMVDKVYDAVNNLTMEDF